MPRLTASLSPAMNAAPTKTNIPAIPRKSENMDTIFSIVSAAQSAPAFAQPDESHPYILPSFADNYEAWACPDTQLPIFEDWIASAATPPSTAIASPNMGQNVLFATSAAPQFSFATSSTMPSLSPPSSNLSAGSSPLLINDIALSLASTTTAVTTPAAMSPQQQSCMFSGGLTVADYAAALFPEIAVGLSSALASPTAAPEMPPKRSASLASLQLPSTAAADAVDWTADISSLFGGVSPSSATELTAIKQKKAHVEASKAARAIKAATKPRASKPKAKTVKVSEATETELDGLSAEEQRKRRDSEFLASLPQQLALKRRRTSNTKQKEKILAELMSGDGSGGESPEPTEDTCADMVAEGEADEQSLDAAALKRKKNTDAARRSRMRKILRIETLETRVSELETENSNLSQLVADMEAERAVMAQRMEEYERHLGAEAGTRPSFMS
ncbi:hypothetical protein IW140_000490 [Coemansia sp. RSA 1813]|nr:hypothetical protein EV178_000551 [Coemansia sp. RSA 1646]KAJ1771260.1 hypothetical protein LPJ74_002528 [Coemansia sp. RSA 1843]KAJ2092829.1 hypothetical protein IW138_000924 [Coemansia sp. RSA 986]KAJ2217671.1 hypothetical protein EV179_000156 [Coemansia sp. RSA 487]KAJ2573091.1 hypothetical protein IW140_000490 [Coemansia sp. RSA 1813]